MNSHKPLYEDDLDQLVRHTLEAKFGSQRPPNRVWKRTKEKLTGGTSRYGQLFSLRSSLVVQIAILLLLLTLGGADGFLEPKLVPITPGTVRTVSAPVSYAPAPSARTVAMVDKDLTAVKNIELPPPIKTAALPVDDHNVHLLDAQLKRDIIHQNNRHRLQPLVVPPTDVVPHRNSLEGRALLADLDRQSASTQEVLAFFIGAQFSAGVIR